MSMPVKDFNKPSEITVSPKAQTSGYIRLYDLEDKPDPAWEFDMPRNSVTDALAVIEKAIRENAAYDLSQRLEQLDIIRRGLMK